jgi:hypothetical protein
LDGEGAGAAAGQRRNAERRGDAAGSDSHEYGARARQAVAVVRNSITGTDVFVGAAQRRGRDGGRLEEVWVMWSSEGGMDFWGICTTRCRAENRHTDSVNRECRAARVRETGEKRAQRENTDRQEFSFYFNFLINI